MSSFNILEIFCVNDEVKSFYVNKINNDMQHNDDTGLDLITAETITIQPFECKLVSLGIKTQMLELNTNKNVGWELWPRSSICKTPLQLANSIGLIDAGYRGEIKAPFRNHSMTPYTIEKGSRLVQAVAFNRHSIQINLVDTLTNTSRGEGGFGSTGK